MLPIKLFVNYICCLRSEIYFYLLPCLFACLLGCLLTFPYGLNQKTRKHDGEVPVGRLLFSISRTMQQSTRYRNNNDYLKNETVTEVFTNIHSIIQNDIEDSVYKLRIILSNLNKIFK